MLFLYNLIIKVCGSVLYILQFFNDKMRLFLEGRKHLMERIAKEAQTDRETVWFHFASLGEFEQGRPVLESLKAQYPDYWIVITFFSPSGYELRKNYALADRIYYLPLDTETNAREFIRLVRPKIAIFTKYEYWYNYFAELHRRQIPLYMISAVFNRRQPFFSWYGGLHRRMLGMVSHFFVQDKESEALLRNAGVCNVSVSGDTRFDRVAENAEQPKDFPVVGKFCKDAKVLIAGSTWPEDEKHLSNAMASLPGWKSIIAPHEIKEEKLQALEHMLSPKTSLRYSKAQGMSCFTDIAVLIIDNVGMLSSVYRYGDISYIGGGFGAGIHNTLEAAAFGLPVIFGPNYHKFLEAKALISEGGGFAYSNEDELKGLVQNLDQEAVRLKAGHIAAAYVQKGRGATAMIIKHLSKILTA